MENRDQAKLVVLIVLDGWGIAPSGPGNAVTLAKTPNISSFLAAYPHTQLAASGEAVGLPKGEMGNTETGHLNLGAGHIVYQDLPRINMAIADGSFFRNKEFHQAVDHANNNGGAVHLMGLIGAGGVHANSEHLFALLQLMLQRQFNNVFLHLFTDGRDSPPSSAVTFLSQVVAEIAKTGIGQIATIMGRYWAMDRDFHWDRTERAYRAMTIGEGNHFKSVQETIEFSYAKGVTDEFIEPAVMVDGTGQPIATIKPGDSVIFFNYRIDRPRQLSQAFVMDNFMAEANNVLSFDPYWVKEHKTHLPIPVSEGARMTPFNRAPKIENLFFVTMTKYDDSIPAHIAFPPEVVNNPVGRIISDVGMRQLRAAESEKERFVTFYFNGQRESPFPGEERLIIPSPKVPTYDQKPEMSAIKLTDEVIAEIQQNQYQFVVVNFANADMVGHTGVIPAAIKACEVVDACVGKIVHETSAFGGVTIITADHGNAEEKIDSRTEGPATEHTVNPVPFIVVGKNPDPRTLPAGILADVAPTILYLFGIKPPPEMTGRNLMAFWIDI